MVCRLDTMAYGEPWFEEHCSKAWLKGISGQCNRLGSGEVTTQVPRSGWPVQGNDGFPSGILTLRHPAERTMRRALLEEVVLGAQVAGWRDERHFRTVQMCELSRPPMGALGGGGVGVPLQQGSQGFPVLAGGLGGRGMGLPLQQGSQGFPVLSAGFVLPPQVPMMPHLLL